MSWHVSGGGVYRQTVIVRPAGPSIASVPLAPPPGDQSVPVPSIDCSLAVIVPTVDQTLAVPSIDCSLAVVAPVADQTVSVPSIDCALAAVAPVRIDQTVSVPSTDCAAAIVAPARIDQTTPVGATDCACAVNPPSVGGAQSVSVPSIDCSAGSVAPVADQTVPLASAIDCVAGVNAPIADQESAVPSIDCLAGVDSPTILLGSSVAVPSIDCAAAIVGPARIDLTLDVPSVAAGAAILAPSVSVDQSISVASIPCVTAIPAPSMGAQAGFYREVSNAIRQRYRIQFADVNSILSQYDNLPFAKPNSATWARVRVIFNESPDILGISAVDTVQMIPGSLDVDLRAPLSQGEGAVLDLVDLLIAVFTNVTVTTGQGQVSFGIPILGSPGIDHSEFSIAVSMPFWGQDELVRS